MVCRRGRASEDLPALRQAGAALQELSTRAMLTLESRRKQMRITSGTAETESGSEEDSEIRNLVLLLAAKWTLCCSSAELVSAG